MVRARTEIRGQRRDSVSNAVPIGTRHGAQTWLDYAGSCEATKQKSPAKDALTINRLTSGN